MSAYTAFRGDWWIWTETHTKPQIFDFSIYLPTVPLRSLFLIPLVRGIPALNWFLYISYIYIYKSKFKSKPLPDSLDRTPGTEFHTFTEQSRDESKCVLFVFQDRRRTRALCLIWHLFSHIIRTVNFRAEWVCAPHVGPLFFTFPMRQLKCKRTSSYSHKRWCRGGKGLQSVGEFHAHHPSFPASKAWICVHVCMQEIYFFLHLCVCAWACVHLKVCIYSNSLGYLTLRSWHTFPASTGRICFYPSAGPFPHFLSRKGGS